MFKNELLKKKQFYFKNKILILPSVPKETILVISESGCHYLVQARLLSVYLNKRLFKNEQREGAWTQSSASADGNINKASGYSRVRGF